jgi:nicotinamidase-related amidase
MKALVVIDVQNAMWENSGSTPYEGEEVVDRIAALIAHARQAGVPVMYVQHHDLEDSGFQPGKPGFPFHDKLTPLATDDVTVKHRGSAFNNTDFDAKLKRAGVDQLIIAGMQSEYCVDSAVRGAVERGYQVTLVADGHSTFDTRFAKAKTIIDIQNDTLSGSYAKVIPAAEVVFN